MIWDDVQNAIYEALVLASDLPRDHWTWSDGPQNFTYDPAFDVTISSVRSVHDRRVVPDDPTVVYSLSSLVEATVGVRCKSIAVTIPGVERRMRALDALEYVRAGLAWRDDVWTLLRAAGVARFDDAGIVRLATMQDDRAVAVYHCDFMMRAAVDQAPRAPALGRIDTVIVQGMAPDAPRPDLEIDVTEPVP